MAIIMIKFAIIMAVLLATAASNDSSRKLLECDPPITGCLSCGIDEKCETCDGSLNFSLDGLGGCTCANPLVLAVDRCDCPHGKSYVAGQCLYLTSFFSSSVVTPTYSNQSADFLIVTGTEIYGACDQLLAVISDPFFGLTPECTIDGSVISLTLNYQYSMLTQVELLKLFKFYKSPGDHFFNFQDLFIGFDIQYDVPQISLKIEGPDQFDPTCPSSTLELTVGLESAIEIDENKYRWDVIGPATDELKIAVTAQTGLSLQVTSSLLQQEGTYEFLVIVDSYYGIEFYDCLLYTSPSPRDS